MPRYYLATLHMLIRTKHGSHVKFLESLRKEQGYSMSREIISSLINGRRNPTVEQATVIARHFEVEPKKLFPTDIDKVEAI